MAKKPHTGNAWYAVRRLDVKADDRGMVAEILRAEHVGHTPYGQLYLSTAKPGVVKGNHYHTRKTEWFFVATGKALLVLKNLKTAETAEIPLDGDRPVVVEIHPNVAHALVNTGKELVRLLAYTSEVFNPADPDTFPEQLR